ncbi:MAG: flagellar hook-associated protein FlgK, partial [Armatimonadota bacterium]
VQDAYLDNRIVDSNQSYSQWSTTSNLLQSVEAQFAEPGVNGLSNTLDGFWNSWRELAASPDGLSSRVALVAKANSLAERVQEIYTNINDLRAQLDVTVSNRIDEINRISGDIAEVNEKIVNLEVTGAAPNDLLDRRDSLVGDLSKIVAVRSHGTGGRDFILNVGGVTLVQGINARPIVGQTDSEGHIQPVWADDQSAVGISSGELRGTLNVRDSFIPEYLDQLDTIATTLVEKVNALHSSGYTMNGDTGQDFFVAGTTARNLALDPALLADPSLVATSANGEQSNSEIAQAIADLSNGKLIGNETISQNYRTLVSKIGGDVGIAERSATTREFTLQQLTKQRDAVSGVSIDDEMVDMVRYQQAFSASARVFEATNSVLDTLMQAVGG